MLDERGPHERLRFEVGGVVPRVAWEELDGVVRFNVDVTEASEGAYWVGEEAAVVVGAPGVERGICGAQEQERSA